MFTEVKIELVAITAGKKRGARGDKIQLHVMSSTTKVVSRKKSKYWILMFCSTTKMHSKAQKLN